MGTKPWVCYPPPLGANVAIPVKKIVILENHYCGFVGNVEVDSGLTLYTHKSLFDCPRTYLNFENSRFFPKNAIFSNFDHFADMAVIIKKMLGKCAEGS